MKIYPKLCFSSVACFSHFPLLSEEYINKFFNYSAAPAAASFDCTHAGNQRVSFSSFYTICNTYTHAHPHTDHNQHVEIVFPLAFRFVFPFKATKKPLNKISLYSVL